MTHTLVIKKFTDKLLEVHFAASCWCDSFSSEEKREATVVALQTLLVFNGYEEGDKSSRIITRQKDFAFSVKKGILIHGKNNVITVLDLLYDATKLFIFQPVHQHTIEGERSWIALELLERITRRMSDPDISKVESQQFKSMVKKYYGVAVANGHTSQIFINACKEVSNLPLAYPVC